MCRHLPLSVDSIPRADSARGPSVAKTPLRKGTLATHVCLSSSRKITRGFPKSVSEKGSPLLHSERSQGACLSLKGFLGPPLLGGRLFAESFCPWPALTQTEHHWVLSLKENKRLQEGRLKAARNLTQPCTPDLRQNLLRHSSWNHSEIPASLIRT